MSCCCSMQTEASRGRRGGREDRDECPGVEAVGVWRDPNGEPSAGLGSASESDERRGGAREDQALRESMELLLVATKRGGGAPGRWGGAEQQPAAGCRRG